MPTVGELLGTDEKLFAPLSVCLLSPVHFPLAFKASLRALYQMATASCAFAEPPLTLPIEACLSHLVLNVPRPVPGGPVVRFALGNGAATVGGLAWGSASRETAAAG